MRQVNALAAPVLQRRAGFRVPAPGGVHDGQLRFPVFSRSRQPACPRTPSDLLFPHRDPGPVYGEIHARFQWPAVQRPPPARSAAPPRRAPGTSAAGNSTRRPVPARFAMCRRAASKPMNGTVPAMTLAVPGVTVSALKAQRPVQREASPAARPAAEIRALAPRRGRAS